MSGLLLFVWEIRKNIDLGSQTLIRSQVFSYLGFLVIL